LKGLDIESLCSRRLTLIDQLESGLLSKEAFICENYEMFSDLEGDEPFRIRMEIETFSEGVMKYHYFNTLAKKYMLDADAVEYREPEQCKRFRSLAYELYIKKDRIALAMLEHVAFKDVTAYYIRMNSKSLEGSIFEIDFLKEDRVVLHSRDPKMRYKLKSAGCFSEELRASKVESYINTKI